MFSWIKKLRHGAATAVLATSAPEAQTAFPVAAPSAQEHASAFKREGNAWLEQGQLGQAAHSFRQAVLADPEDAAACINLAYVLCEQESFEEARTLLDHAVTLDPNNFDAHYMLGTACKELGARDAAIEHIRRSLALKPDFAIALRDLCALLAAGGRAPEAMALLEQGIAIARDTADYYFMRGNLLIAQDLLENAAASFRQALSLRSNDPPIWANLGVVLMRLDQNDEAAQCCERALGLDPDCAEAHVNLACVYGKLGRLGQARWHGQKALALRPGDPNAHSYMGVIFQSEGRMQEAIAAFLKALTLDARHIESLEGLGQIYQAIGDMNSALDYRNRVVSIHPEHAAAHTNLGATLHEMGDLEGAAACYREALRLDPKFVAAHSNLGAYHLLLGKRDLAAASLRRALDIDPDFVSARSVLLFSMSTDETRTASDYLSEARRYGITVAKKASHLTQPDWSRQGDALRPLKVGFLSGDLREHPVGRFLEATVSQIDAERLELVAYSTYAREDARTAQLKPLFRAWHMVAGLSDKLIAEKIRADEIDVLIDLSGHTAQNRLPVFAWRPAQVQASWLGYWASTGIAEMDYVLVDPISATRNMATQFVEKLWFLPDTRMCYSTPPFMQLATVSAAPRHSKGYPTFGSFQVLNKINNQTLSVWSEVLGKIPDARLRVQSMQLSEPSARNNFSSRLVAAGISMERTELHGRSPLEQYLAAYAAVDLVLDTFPFTGGTTTCEALWMGVPTLTLAGETLIARQGASLMNNAGLPEFVAHSKEDYVNKAVALALDPSKLQTIRAGLREKVLASPLFDSKRFARNLEEALIGMWHHKTGR